ncbi:hypothetical protein BKA69DRAFT_108976 [Paraphysoderma sedebokerense]|nr:hypothetical protein BKA69DRAFT_108976 [Paraphysoderma sedebokerense]
MTNVAPLTPPSRRVKLLRYTCVTLWLLLNSIAINSVQIFFLFTLYPIIPNYLFRRLIKHTQTAFSQVLIGLCYFFAPNELVITGESDGDWDWKRLFSGNQSSEELNKKFVVISNHLVRIFDCRRLH